MKHARIDMSTRNTFDLEEEDATTERKLEGPTSYCQLFGNLVYLIITRSDIIYAVNVLCQHMQKPTNNDMKATQRILQYIKNSLEIGLLFATSLGCAICTYSDDQKDRLCDIP